MKLKYTWWFSIVVLILPLAVYAVTNFYQLRYASLPVIERNSNEPVSFSLLNQEGNSCTAGEWEGRVVVANFFYTGCPVVCPKMMYSLKQVAAAFPDEKNFIYSFSVDPLRDSVTRLKRYAGRFNCRSFQWQLLTGDKKSIYKLARNGLMLVTAEGDGGPEDFIHSDKLVLIDQQGRIRGYYTGTEQGSVRQLINDIKKLKK